MKRNSCADGLPITVIRDDGNLELMVEGFGDVTNRFPEIVEGLAAAPPRSFHLTGELVFYRGWTRQPVEVAEVALETEETPKGLRPLLLLYGVESVDGRSAAQTDDRERHRVLSELVRDSDVIQKRGPADGVDEDSNATSRTAQPDDIDQDGHEEDRSMDGAVDVLYSCGYLDLEGVEARIEKMKREIGERDAAIEDLRGRVEREKEERDGERTLVELGRSRVGEWRNQSIAKLRAIRVARGEEPGDDPRIRILEDAETDPATIRDIYRTVAEEFSALFPTEPVSTAAPGGEAHRVRWDWDSFRI